MIRPTPNASPKTLVAVSLTSARWRKQERETASHLEAFNEGLKSGSRRSAVLNDLSVNTPTSKVDVKVSIRKQAYVLLQSQRYMNENRDGVQSHQVCFALLWHFQVREG